MTNFFDVFKQKNDQRKTIPIILAIGISGNTNGGIISALNSAIGASIEKFANYNSHLENEYSTKIAILTFSSGAQWITNGFVDPADFHFSGITCGGTNDLGSALNELNCKLSRDGFLTEDNSYSSPFICFVTDGAPIGDYAFSLEKLKENSWYRIASKFAVTIGDDDFSKLNEVVGNREAVIQLRSEEFLEQTMSWIWMMAMPARVCYTLILFDSVCKCRRI